MVLSYYNKTGDAATLARALPIMEVDSLWIGSERLSDLL
jgi:hypothetical protein